MKKRLHAGHLMVLWSCATLLATQLAASAQVLAHRYSFYSATNGTPVAMDLVGTNNGTLDGDANITGGQLVLDGAAYVQLEQGIVTNDLAVTVEAWGDFPTLANQGGWANLFDFGTQDVNGQDSYSLSFCVNTDSPVNDLDAAISDFDNANVNRQNCYAASSLIAGGNDQYVAAVFDPPAGYIAIYVNGVLASRITGVTNTITPGIRDLDNWIGKDNWPDPSMTGSLDEFRVWNGALNGLEVAASYQNTFTNLNTNAGTILSVTLTAASPITLGGQEPISVVATASLITNSADITPIATITSASTNVITVDSTGTLHGVGLGSSLITASFGGKSNSVTVSVISAVSVLTHRISFSTPVSSSNTVADSVGTLYATLEGDAVESGGQAVLDGTVGTYIDLSSNSFANDGIISGYTSATVDFWATFGSMSIWSYAWSFGTEPAGGGGVNYLYFAANNGGNNPEINENGTAFNSTGNFSDSTVHCTTVFDPSSGIMALYTNGVLSASVTDDYTPLSYIATNYVYFGRSLWTSLAPPFSGDPFLPTNSSFQEIRVYKGALTAAQIAMSQQSGPNNTNINPGALQSFTLSAPTTVQWLQTVPLKLLANYANLTNFDILGNSVLAPVGLTITSSDPSVVAISGAHGVAAGPGTATVTVSYNGISDSTSISVVPAPPPVLTHRYSFSTGTANDLVGTDNGVLTGSASITNGLLMIPNASQAAPATDYLLLPDGIITNSVDGLGTNNNDPSVTIEAWASFGASQGYWACFFDFGYQDPNDNGAYDIHFGQLGGNDIIGISDTDNANVFNESITTGTVRGLTNVHIVCVFNPLAGYEAVYTNGVIAGIDNGVTISMAGIWATNNKIGADLWPDPGMQGSVSEFRIYNGVLTPDQVAADYKAGPSTVVYGTATTLTHRISFSTPVSSSNTVADSVGTLYATLEGDAKVSGGKVLLDGTTHTYVDLSSNSFANNGLISGYAAATIDFWASFGNMGAWCYGWSLGNQATAGGGEDFLYLSVNNGGGHPQLDESSSGIVLATGGALSDSMVHCTTVLNPSTGLMALYTNGVLSGSVSDDYSPLSSIATNYIYFGRSLWTDLGPPYTGDPYLPTNSSYQEIRVYNGALTPEQIAMADLSGPNNTNINPGALQSFTLTAPASVQWLQAAPLTALATYANVSNVNVTAFATYSSGNTDIATVDSSGNVHGVGLGSTTVTASYEGKSSSAVTVTVVRAPAAVLIHRYSFSSGTANDSVGTANGVLHGNASIKGGQLLLPNATSAAPGLDYLELPYGIITNATGTRTNYNGPPGVYNDPSVTVEAWATIYPNQYTWAELFDFGNTDSGGLGEYDIHVCIHAGGTPSDTFIGISDSDNANNDYQYENVPGGSALDGKTNIYIAAVFNPPAGYLAIYTNGVLMGENSSITIPMAGVWAVTNKIGADVWPDPGLQGSVAEFRIYNGVLSPDQIAADYVLGPNALPGSSASGPTISASFSGGNIVISWPVSGTSGYSLYTSSTIGPNAVWTLVTGANSSVVDGNNQVSIATSGGGTSQFYVLKN